MSLCVCGHTLRDHSLHSGGCSKCKTGNEAHKPSMCNGFRHPQLTQQLAQIRLKASQRLVIKTIRTECPGCEAKGVTCKGRIRCYI